MALDRTREGGLKLALALHLSDDHSHAKASRSIGLRPLSLRGTNDGGLMRALALHLSGDRSVLAKASRSIVRVFGWHARPRAPCLFS